MTTYIRENTFTENNLMGNNLMGNNLMENNNPRKRKYSSLLEDSDISDVDIDTLSEHYNIECDIQEHMDSNIESNNTQKIKTYNTYENRWTKYISIFREKYGVSN